MFLTKTLSCFSLAKIIKRQKPQNFNCVFLILYICKKQKEYKSETFQKTKSIIETSAEQQNERMGSVFYCMTRPLVGMKITRTNGLLRYCFVSLLYKQYYKSKTAHLKPDTLLAL